MGLSSSPFILAIQLALDLIGAISIYLATRAVLIGPWYIAIANKGWTTKFLRRVMKGRWIFRIQLQMTVPAIAVVGSWAAYSILYDLFFFLGNAGFTDGDGEFTTYRSSLSLTAGLMLGLAFSYWLVRLCESYARTMGLKDWDKSVRDRSLRELMRLDEDLE